MADKKQNNEKPRKLIKNTNNKGMSKELRKDARRFNAERVRQTIEDNENMKV